MQSQTTMKMEAHHDKIANKVASETKVHFLEDELDFISYFIDKINDIKQLSRGRPPCMQNLKKYQKESLLKRQEINRFKLIFYQTIVAKIKRKIDKQSDNLQKEIVYIQSVIHITNERVQKYFQQVIIDESYQNSIQELNLRLMQSQNNVQKGEMIKKQFSISKDKATSAFCSHFAVKYQIDHSQMRQFINIKNKVMTKLHKKLTLLSKIKSCQLKFAKINNQNILISHKTNDNSYNHYQFFNKQAQYYRNKSYDQNIYVTNINIFQQQSINKRFYRESRKPNNIIMDIQKQIFQKQIQKLKYKNATLQKSNEVMKQAIQNRQNRKFFKNMNENLKQYTIQQKIMKQIIQYQDFNRYYEQKFSTCNLKWMENSDSRVDNKYYLTEKGLKVKEWNYFITQPLYIIRQKRNVKSQGKKDISYNLTIKKKGITLFSIKNQAEKTNESQPKTMCSFEKSKGDL